MSNKVRSIKRAAKREAQPVERLSPEILQLLRNSAARLNETQAAHNAVAESVCTLYNLKAADSVNLETGEITRSE